MTRHTPGPWYVSGTIDGYAIRYRDQADYYTIATAHDDIGAWRNTDDEEAAANARLIAAAPELLEALRMMLEDADDAHGRGDGTPWVTFASMNRARAAIAKATGDE